MIRNARQEYVSIRIVSVSHSHLNVSFRSRPIVADRYGFIQVVTFSNALLLIAFGVFYLYMQIVADRCEWLISYADKYVLLQPLRWMMKPLATAPMEQESESSTIVFLVPDDVLRIPLA